MIPANSNSPAAPRGVGARLRAQRDALGWTLAEATERSGVKGEHIVAIERGRTDTLPPVGYVLGYVRAYANVLGLDAPSLVADYKRELAGAPARRPRGVPHFVPDRRLRLPRGTLPALSVVAAMSLLGAWYGVQLDTRDAPAPAPAPQTPLRPAPDAAPIEAVPDSVVTLRATAPSWVSIRDARGRLVVNRVFVTDEQWQAERGEPFTVSVRDGGAVELRVGSRSLGPLGRPGEPVADFALGAVQ